MAQPSEDRSINDFFALLGYLLHLLILAFANLVAFAALVVFILVIGITILAVGHFSSITGLFLAILAFAGAHALAWLAREPARDLAFFPHWRIEGGASEKRVRAPGIATAILILAVLAASGTTALALHYASEALPSFVDLSGASRPRILTWALFFVENILEILTFGAPTAFGFRFSGVSPGNWGTVGAIWAHRIFLDVILLRLLFKFVAGYHPAVFSRS